MPVSLAARGLPLAGQSFAGGEAVYYPSFVSDLGLDLAALERDLSDARLYNSRDLAATKIRGSAIKREKFYATATADRGQIPIYSFPGFQWAAVEHYKHEQDPEFATLQPLFAAVRGLVVNGRDYEFNQLLGTRYRDGRDKITMHSDDARSIDPDGHILNISLGETRTFVLASKATGAVEKVPMASGSAVLMSMEGNASHKHGVLEERACAGPRVSLVFRNIRTVMGREQVARKVAAAGKSKAARDLKKVV